MIRFEYAIDPVIVSTAVLGTVHELAQEFPDKDIRVTDDGNTNVKVYIGTLNQEQYRIWVYTDGRIILKEEDISDGHALGEWQAIVDAPLP